MGSLPLGSLSNTGEKPVNRSLQFSVTCANWAVCAGLEWEQRAQLFEGCQEGCSHPRPDFEGEWAMASEQKGEEKWKLRDSMKCRYVAVWRTGSSSSNGQRIWKKLARVEGPWTWWHMKCQRMWGAGPWRPFSTVEGKECKTRTVSCRSWLMLLAEMVSVVLTHAICTHSFIFSPKIFSKFLLYAAHHSTHWRYGDEKTNCPHEVYRLVGKIHTYIPTYIYTHTTHMCV